MSLTKDDILNKTEVDPVTKCWMWTGSKTKSTGYGIANKNWEQAHVAAYKLWRGPIPDGYHVHHKCRRRACVNPDHLEAVTRATNVFIGVAEKRGQQSWRTLRVARMLHDAVGQKPRKR